MSKTPLRISMPSRILDRHVGGNTTYARTLVEGLTQLGHEVERIKSGSSPYATAFFETAAGLARGVETDVLHFVADTGPVIRTNRPSVVTVHGVASNRIQNVRKPVSERIWRSRVGLAIKSCDKVITVSHSSARDIQEVFDVNMEKLTVIPHGIDAVRFRHKVSLSNELEPFVPPRFALYVGNIEPRKNLPQLCRSFGSKQVKDLGVPLVIAGKPAWESDEIMREVERSENVTYLGFVSDSDRIALMQRTDLFVFPSRYEGFGFPVLEAMAAGAVTASSRSGSLADVAGPALSLDIGSDQSLTESLVVALTDSKRRQSSLGESRTWVDGFSWSKSVEQHVQVYRAAFE